MKHMVQTTCLDCWWCKITDSKRECHFNAPKIISGIGTGGSNQNWPIVQINDFCSEAYPKDGK